MKKAGRREGVPLLPKAVVSRSVAVAAVTAAPVVFPAYARAFAITVSSLAGIGADGGACRAANNRADGGAFGTPGRRAADHRAGAGTDNRTADGILRIRANRHGCKRSQGRRRKNCLAHR